MSRKIYIYGLCDVLYDGYYIQGLKELYGNYTFNISKFPAFSQGTFAVIIEDQYILSKIIIDSKDSKEIDLKALKWCDIYGKVNYNLDNLLIENKEKILPIGPSFGIKIWTLVETLFFLTINFIRFRELISNKREFIANYWRQYMRLNLKYYIATKSSNNEVFLINSIWKKETETNRNRALFIENCKSNSDIIFEGGFAARKNGDNLGFDDLVYSQKIPLKVYIKKNKNSAFVFNTPAVLSCHGWKLAEFLALGKAIISTPHVNQLPKALINNKQLMYAENDIQLKKVIEQLIKDIDFKRKLEFESRKYFDQYLAPKKVIIRLMENL